MIFFIFQKDFLCVFLIILKICSTFALCKKDLNFILSFNLNLRIH